MLMYHFVSFAEEVSEEFAGRVPGPELHRLNEQSLINFWRVCQLVL
jgi:hypothetical protein